MIVNNDNDLHYLAKYLAKTDTVNDITINYEEDEDEEITPKEYFHGRAIGSVEAVYDLRVGASIAIVEDRFISIYLCLVTIKRGNH